MKTPLYIITEDDGIPIPNNTFILDVPSDKTHFFKTSSRDEAGEQVEKLILGTCSTDDPWELMTSHEKILENLHNIGTICRVLKQEDAENFRAVWLRVEERVKLNNLSVDKTGEQQIIWVDDQYVTEMFAPGEEEVIGQIKDLIKLISSHPTKFSNDLVKELKGSYSLLSKLDMIANSVLVQSQDKLAYVQTEENYIRLNIVLKQVKNEAVSASSKRRKARRAKPRSQPQSTKEVVPTIKDRFEATPFPPNVEKQLRRDLNKLENLQKSSTEYSMTLDYLTWAVEVPWGKHSYREFNLQDFIPKLDESHYGLTDIKEHLLEHMTIERLLGGSTGTVLCFLGEPGTGKTSIAKAIAAVSNRKLERIALGGLADEADIRGHRRTYVASRPGRLITGLKRSEVMDPLFLLDEIDKVAKYKGDPTAALLEVLDPEQNDHFIDRYMEVPIDLSRAMFICTANYEEQIPPALLDRMELIHFRKYKRDERLAILEKFLLPRSLKDYNLVDHPIKLSEEVAVAIAKTEDVRRIEKQLKKLLRMAAVKIEVQGKDSVVINNEFAKHVLNDKTSSKFGF